MKTKKTNEELAYNANAELKRKELINLKNTIDHNKEIFQAKVNKKKFMDIKNQQLLLEQKNAILERGENPNFFMPRKIKMEEAEKAKK